MAQKEVHVAVATGRPYDLVKPVIDHLGLTGLSIINGGSQIVDVASGQVRYSRSLTAEALREIVKAVLPFGYRAKVAGRNFGSPIRSPKDITEGGEQLIVEAVAEKDASKIIAAISAIKGVASTYDFGAPHQAPAAFTAKSWTAGNFVDIHIVQAHATKRYGVTKLLELLDIQREDAIGMGDGQIDIPLLESVGLKIAMGNAPDEVKAIADFVAPSLAEDGVAFAIEHFVLGRTLPTQPQTFPGFSKLS
jgi:Cof subfamily protein (haloacid dehalogenase superfamily)